MTPNQDALVIILQTIGYYILDEVTIVNLFKKIKSNIQTEISILNQPKVQLDIYMALEKWLSHAEEIETET